jgi:hypothetical protein
MSTGLSPQNRMRKRRKKTRYRVSQTLPDAHHAIDERLPTLEILQSLLGVWERFYGPVGLNGQLLRDVSYDPRSKPEGASTNSSTIRRYGYHRQKHSIRKEAEFNILGPCMKSWNC